MTSFINMMRLPGNMEKGDGDNHQVISFDREFIKQGAREIAGAGFERILDAIKAKYGSVVKNKEVWHKGTVYEFFKEYRENITEMFKEYPHVNVDGVEMIAGISTSAMPFLKEFLQAKFLKVLLKDKILLLPRYVNGLFNEIFDVFLMPGSLSEGLLLISGEDKYIEFKYSNIERFVSHANKGLKQGQIVFSVVTESSDNKIINKLKDKVYFSSEKQCLLVLNLLTGTLMKKGTLNSALEIWLRDTKISHTGTEEIESFHLNYDYIHELVEVKEQEREFEMMDYQKYTESHKGYFSCQRLSTIASSKSDK